jgi:hypothetical protein
VIKSFNYANIPAKAIMTYSIWFYLKNVFINPKAAANAITEEQNLWLLIIWSSLLGIIPYWLIVILGYRDLGWGAFPYKEYYPYYFEPYWWEMFLVPVWGLVIALGFGLPCYFFGKWLGGQGTFKQVVAIIMLASVVSLPIMVTVDLLLPNPESTYQFATTGTALNNYQPGENYLIWIIEQSYFFIAMAWQGIVTLVGLAVIHHTRWYLQIPGLVLGNMLFFAFLLAIRDYVALII